MSFPQALVSSATATYLREPDNQEGFASCLTDLIHDSKLILLLDDLESVAPDRVSKFLSDIVTAQKELATLATPEDRLFIHRIVCASRSVALNRQPVDSRIAYLLLSAKIKKEAEKIALLDSVTDKKPLTKESELARQAACISPLTT